MAIVVREKKSVGLVTVLVEEIGVDSDHKVAKEGILVFSRGSDNYRNLVNTFKNSSVDAHWSQRRADKGLRTISSGGWNRSG